MPHQKTEIGESKDNGKIMNTIYNAAVIAGIYAFASPLIIGPVIIYSEPVLIKTGLVRPARTNTHSKNLFIAFTMLLLIGPITIVVINEKAGVIATTCLLAILLIGHGHIWALPILMASLWITSLIWALHHLDKKAENPILQPTPINILRLIAAKTKKPTKI